MGGAQDRPRLAGAILYTACVSAGVVLPQTFFARPALAVARDLIGCSLFVDGCGGRIVETEAYEPADPSSHAYRGKTARNAVMFGPPGYLYVYFVYGMHHCANVSCDAEGVGAAVLLRALEPRAGLAEMTARRGTADPRLLCSGPARLAQALGLTRAANGVPLEGMCAAAPSTAVAMRPCATILAASGAAPIVVSAPRIGVRDDKRPWRFLEAGSGFVSRPVPRGARGRG